MKLFLLLASLVVAISAATDEELWLKFKQDHGKTYKSLRDDKLRFKVFKSNLKTIREHNINYEKGYETWFMGVNEFTDMTDEEFKAQYLNNKRPEVEFIDEFSPPSNFTAPDSMDWREKGAVTSVKYQGGCGSCWAFSAVGALEGQNAIKHNGKEDLSAQELVDCSRSYGTGGCHGGWMNTAFLYVKDHGISKESDYPYKGEDQCCKSQANTAGLKLKGYIDVPKNEESMKLAVASVGPLSVGIDAENFRHYEGGIFDFFFCGFQINHAVLVVGYGTENNHDYWIVKNSWGNTWGDKGYIKMTRNRFNQCSIASHPSYPVLE